MAPETTPETPGRPRDLLVITNKDAGSTTEEALEQALQVLRAERSVEVAESSDPDELDEVLRGVGDRQVVVAGGDGSIHAVVAALHQSGRLADVVLSLLPMGTGNDFARGTGIPLEPAEAARVVLDGDVRELDLILNDQDEVVVNNVHVGAGAQASRRGDRWKQRLGKVKLGKLGYPIGAALAAFQPPYMRLRVEVDGRLVNDPDRPVLMVAIGNSSHVGGGTELNPDADVEGGSLDIVISRAIGPWSKLAYVAHLGRGRHTERDDVQNVTGKQIRVSGESFWCSADGEIKGPVQDRSWRLLPDAYRMLLPTPHQRDTTN